MTSTNFLFRCDGNSDIGSGHIMRCISIADAGKRAGIRSTFLIASDEFTSIIEQHGHTCQILHTDYSAMNSDLDTTREWAEQLHPCALFVDSYYVADDYLASLHHTCHTHTTILIYIDDVLAFPYPCDILINYNIYGPDRKADYQDMYRKAERSQPQLLLGTAYAPLRAEFQDLPVRCSSKKAEHILISTGGADAGHTGLHLIREISRRGHETGRFQFHFVIGAVNEDAEAMRSLAASVSNVTLHHNVQRMSALMCSCDLAVSAAGSTLYELCVTQTPAITYVLADNQIPGADGFVRHGVMKSCGDVRSLGGGQLAKKLIDEAIWLADHEEARAVIAAKQRKTVDGMGAGRIVDEIVSQYRKMTDIHE